MRTKLMVLALGAWLVVAAEASAAADPNFWVYLCFGQSNMESGTRLEEMDRVPVNPRFQVLADFDNPTRGWKKGTWYKADPPITARGAGSIWSIISGGRWWRICRRGFGWAS